MNELLILPENCLFPTQCWLTESLPDPCLSAPASSTQVQSLYNIWAQGTASPQSKYWFKYITDETKRNKTNTAPSGERCSADECVVMFMLALDLFRHGNLSVTPITAVSAFLRKRWKLPKLIQDCQIQVCKQSKQNQQTYGIWEKSI